MENAIIKTPLYNSQSRIRHSLGSGLIDKTSLQNFYLIVSSLWAELDVIIELDIASMRGYVGFL